MAKPNYRELLIKLRNGEVSNDDIDRLLIEEDRETRGRPRKILLEDQRLVELKKEVNKANRTWVARALWVRMESHIFLAKSEREKVINNASFCKGVTKKVLEKEITTLNKLKGLDGFVIKVLFDSVIFGTEKDFEIGKFSNAFIGDPLAAFYGIDTGVVTPASIVTLKVFVSRSIFMKFREKDLLD